eukprot:2509526-Pyramimonas_sp.AAC.1
MEREEWAHERGEATHWGSRLLLRPGDWSKVRSESNTLRPTHCGTDDRWVERAPYDARAHDRSEGDSTPTQPGGPRGTPNAQEGPRGTTEKPSKNCNETRRNFYCQVEKVARDSQTNS